MRSPWKESINSEFGIRTNIEYQHLRYGKQISAWNIRSNSELFVNSLDFYNFYMQVISIDMFAIKGSFKVCHDFRIIMNIPSFPTYDAWARTSCRRQLHKDTNRINVHKIKSYKAWARTSCSWQLHKDTNRINVHKIKDLRCLSENELQLTIAQRHK